MEKQHEELYYQLRIRYSKRNNVIWFGLYGTIDSFPHMSVWRAGHLKARSLMGC
jgi:hypothetical protein